VIFQAPLVNHDVYERYRTHQAKITAKNVEVSAIIGDELWKIQARKFYPRLQDYMIAAWMAANGKGTAPELAAARDLDVKVLNQWIKYLKPDGNFRNHLKRWREADESNVARIAAEYDQVFQGPAKQWGAILAEWRTVTEASNRGEKPSRSQPLQVALGYTSNDPHFERFVTDPLQRFVSEIACPANQNLDAKGIEDGPFVLSEAASENLLPGPVRERIAAIRKEIEELRKTAPPKPAMANAVGDGPALGDGPMVAQRVFIRGSYSNEGEPVERGFPEIVRAGHDKLAAQGSGRLELARWMIDPANPLPARVMVNRIWEGHFGEGLVRTPNNFGLMGELPTHPELLDYLAKRFVEGGWSIKKMHRTMMLTSLYQSSSEGTAQSWETDPFNRLWSRFTRRRITIEEMRDSWLQFSNTLDLKTGSIFDQTGGGGGMARGRGAGAIPFDTSRLRTVYLPVSRNGIFTPMVLNDFVDSTTSAGDRPETIVAPQALYLMNNAFVSAQADGLAKVLLAAGNASDDDRVRHAFRIVWNREPDTNDVERAVEFMKRYPAGANGPSAAWSGFCRTLMSANQFHYIE
jgi:hypothetical protein